MTSPLIAALLRQGGSPGLFASTPQWNRMLVDSFPKQREFVLSGDIANAGRGAGKSGGAALKFHGASANNPGRSSVFITISAERSRDILLPPLLRMDQQYGLGLREYRKANAIIWPNGYRVLFRGCKDRTEANKRRGTPWVLAGWDECDAIHSNLLEYDIHECVEPRLADYRGKWFATGTPGAIETGYWHELCSGKNPSYQVVHWDARDNPYMPDAEGYFLQMLRRMLGLDPREDLLKALVRELCKGKQPEGLSSPRDFFLPEFTHYLPAKFQREYLGLWAKDAAALVYHLSQLNSFAGAPPIVPERTTIGLDLGGASAEQPDLDHCAWTVAQSTSLSPRIYIPESRKVADMTPQRLAAQCLRLCDQYGAPEKEGGHPIVYVDSASAGKLIEREFRLKGLAVRPAIKGPKKPRIQLVQHVLRAGDLQLSYAGTTDLRDEATVLVWNDRHTDHNPKCADDCWDSALYAVIPHLNDYEPEEEPPRPGSREEREAEEQAEYDAAFEEACREIDEEAA